MSYHPIIGILTLLLCVVLAYFIGKVITRNNILSWRKTKDDKEWTARDEKCFRRAIQVNMFFKNSNDVTNAQMLVVQHVFVCIGAHQRP